MVENSTHGPDTDRAIRIVIIGDTGVGKTTLATLISSRLALPQIELDDLFWGPGWTEPPPDVFRARVATHVAGDRWVLAGNYSRVRDLVWPRATMLIWVHYSFLRGFKQLFFRTVRRAITRERLFGGNTESFSQSFFSRDSILLWKITSHRRHEEFFSETFATRAFDLEYVELRHPRERDAFVQSLPKLSRPREPGPDGFR